MGGGSGHDLLVATQPDTTIKVNAPGDEVMVCGPPAPRWCARAALLMKVIYAGRGASVAQSCRDPDDRVLPLTQLAKPAAHAAAQPVSGNGSKDSSLLRGVRQPSRVLDCTVSSFAARTLKGWWANEFVPAYRCPLGRSLSRSHYALSGTKLPNGVEVRGSDRSAS